MGTRMRHTAIPTAVIIGLLVGGSPAAVANHDGDPNEIHACVKLQGGQVRILTAPSDVCSAAEFALTWSIVGPQGPQGPQGAEGPQGPPGPSGSFLVSLTAAVAMAIGTGEEHDDCPRFFDQDFGPVATVGPSVSLPVPLGTGTYLPVPAGLRWFISKKLDFFFTLSELNDPTYYAGDVVAEIVRVGGAAPGDEPPAVVSTFTRGFKSTGQGEGVNFNREFQSFTVFTPGFYLLRLTSIAARCSIADIAGTVDILRPVEF